MQLRPHAAFLIALLGFVPALLPGTAQAQASKEYTPQVGQEGKDVIWVPTPQALVERMLDMAKLTSKDIHYDLGSGDGRTVITAAKRGTQSYGVEFNPDMVALSERNAAKEGVAGKAKFINGDIFQTDFSKATVLTLYLLPSLNVKLRPTILKMKPGTRVVSHAFTMDDWQADQTDTVDGRTAYLWIVPAQVNGTWKVGTGTLSLQQQYQMLTGTLTMDGTETPIKGQIRGERISFTTGKAQYEGRVNGNTISDGVVDSMAAGVSSGSWTATRVNP